MRSPHRQTPSRLAAIAGLIALSLATAACSTAASGSRHSRKLDRQQLAQHLTERGDQMYGAFWCPHCAEQKKFFGKSADELPYVECDPRGENAQPQICQAKNVAWYPTWEINGELHVGVFSPAKLAKLSGYTE